MQSFVNQGFLTKRAKYAKWGMYVGFGALIIGLMTTNRNPLVAYVFLIVGLLGATLGSYMSNRYVKEPRSDQVLDEAMSGLDKRYTVYHYMMACNHLVLSHHGLTVLLPQPQEGQIIYDNGRWQHRAGLRKLMQFFGEPGLGKPDQELAKDIEWVQKWVNEWAEDEVIPINGVIVFTSPRAVLQNKGGQLHAVQAADLARFMKEGLKGGETLATARLKELRRLLDEVAEEN